MSATTSAIESVLVENRVFPPADAVVKAARISGMAGYEALCKEAEADFEGFWAKQARANVQWTKPFTRTLDESNAPFFRWFDDGELNASANCLDKHIGTPTENKTAIIFEADDGEVNKITYKELLANNPTAAGKMLFMTGDVIKENFQGFLRQHSLTCLPKPFALREFHAAIAKIINAG